MAVYFDPPQMPTGGNGVVFFTRHGERYIAIYDRNGKLRILERQADGHGRPSITIPSHSQTFKRLADGNRGNKFTPV